MINLYWGLFIAGVVLAVASLALGGLDLNFELEGIDFLLPVKPIFIMVFIVVFGGSGIIFTSLIGQWLAFIPSVALGYIVAKPTERLFTVYLRKYETEAVARDDIVGSRATVIEAIKNDLYGQIQFVIDDKTILGTAKMDDSQANGFRINDIVYITRVDGGVYYVTSEEMAKSLDDQDE